MASIGGSAFYGCSSLPSITIPGSVLCIDDKAFMGCTNLTSATMQEGLLAIGCKAFAYCDNLTTVTIPSSLIAIGENAFYKDKKLSSIFINADIPMECVEEKGITLGSGLGFCKSKQHNIGFMTSEIQTSTGSGIRIADTQVTDNCTLYVPMEAVEDYKIANGWCDFTHIVGFDTTGIKDIEDITSMNAEARKQRIYSISGVRMSKPKPGLNIINGRKVIVK